MASSFRIPSSASVVPAFHPSSQERVKRWLPSSKMAGSFPNFSFHSGASVLKWRIIAYDIFLCGSV